MKRRNKKGVFYIYDTNDKELNKYDIKKTFKTESESDLWDNLIKLKEEKIAIKVLSQGAALRFLLTRVFDYINTVDNAFVKIKDPEEYLKRLEFHKNARSFEDYLI